MKKINNKFYIFVAIILLSTSCNNFLESDIPGKLSQSDFYKTDEDAMQATTAVYDLLQGNSGGVWFNIYIIKTFPSDESQAGGAGPGDLAEYHQLDDFSTDSQNACILGTWRMLYYTIARANKVVNLIKPDNALRTRLIAEAKTIRAYCYFELVTMWGGVPIVLNDIQPSNWTSQKRASKAEVYAQIEKDLKESIVSLPLKSGYNNGDKFRVSKGTAQAILGKTYLYQEKWALATEQFDAVVSSNEYGLEPKFSKIFSHYGEFGTESIFEVSFTSKLNYDWGFDFGSGRNEESNIHIKLMGPNEIYYVPAPSDSLLGGWGFNNPSTKIWNTFIEAGDTVRRANTLMSLAELRAKGGDYTLENDYEVEGIFRRKYGPYSTETSSNPTAVPDVNFGTNWRLIRYADILLMASEAYYRSGNENKSREMLNQVRDRAHLPHISSSGTTLFKAIVTERELELAFEGFRFPDLVRWGLATQELGSLGFQSGKNELMPIPSEDIRFGSLQQNPNY